MPETKFCQSCIERGYSSPGIATREWLPGVYYCDECFGALLDNLTNISVGEVQKHVEHIPKTIEQGPVLDALYQVLSIPSELQFDRVETVQRNHDKLFVFHSPAIVNRTLENIAEELEQLAMALFHIKYRMEPLEQRVDKLKQERRKEKNLIGYNDSKEQYSKTPKAAAKAQTKAVKVEKVAKGLNMSPEALAAMLAQGAEIEKKKKEREFNIIAGNCAECGEHADVIVKEKGEDIPYCNVHAVVVGAK